MVSPVDAIVLAGDRGAARAVAGVTNKALLALGGHSLLQRVLLALGQVAHIRSITVVGPEAQLADTVANTPLATPVLLLEQEDTAYQNFWKAFTRLTQGSGENPDRQVLVLGADMPLISRAEIDEFLARCAERPLDYCVGMSAEQALQRFYPRDGRPGIHMRYLHLAEASLRLNNLHLVRPLRVENRAYIEDIYGFRYQRDFRNMLRTARDLLSQQGIGWRALYLYLMLQLAEVGHQLGWKALWRFARRKVRQEEVEGIASAVLRTRAGIVETTLGGCAIDVDNDRDYAVLQERWEEFSRPPPLPGEN
ncbi:NTP transferase domain-containing protein [Parahaliea maris]|uniref:NTP transferase domain-containing protein n=1 Tax=Parahaliea maris TaxID=2716870 RepID=UPI001650099A|nr:NTP transferase domain-containing protein [Parahaliea maris]